MGTDGRTSPGRGDRRAVGEEGPAGSAVSGSRSVPTWWCSGGRAQSALAGERLPLPRWPGEPHAPAGDLGPAPSPAPCHLSGWTRAGPGTSPTAVCIWLQPSGSFRAPSPLLPQHLAGAANQPLLGPTLLRAHLQGRRGENAPLQRRQWPLNPSPRVPKPLTDTWPGWRTARAGGRRQGRWPLGGRGWDQEQLGSGEKVAGRGSASSPPRHPGGPHGGGGLGPGGANGPGGKGLGVTRDQGDLVSLLPAVWLTAVVLLLSCDVRVVECGLVERAACGPLFLEPAVQPSLLSSSGMFSSPPRKLHAHRAVTRHPPGPRPLAPHRPVCSLSPWTPLVWTFPGDGTVRHGAGSGGLCPRRPADRGRWVPWSPRG